jgi:bacteriocin biosynthesis cyclodehydratase domain-containing protein
MAGETQIGTDPRHAVVVSGVSESLTPLLHALDGRHTAEELMARAGPEHRATLGQILAGLAGLGLLDDAAPFWPADTGDPPIVGSPARLSADRTAWALRGRHQQVSVCRQREQALVVVHGNGRIAVAVATLLAASGIGWVHTVATGVVQPEDTGSGYLSDDIGVARSDAAAMAVRRVAPDTRTNRPGPRRRPDLVLITDATVPDPQLSSGLAAAGIPHLMVHAAEGTGVVGPLVVPGRTSCLRCVDLHNTDTDPCWPALAAQLAAHPQPADLASAHATAAFAVGQALRFLHGPGDGLAELPAWGAAVEIDVFTGRSTQVEWRPHPHCPCGVARNTPQAEEPQRAESPRTEQTRKTEVPGTATRPDVARKDARQSETVGVAGRIRS